MARVLSPQRSTDASGAGIDLTEESLLKDTPSDLICPITHELFRDPVINSVGQVYERSAIAAHLRYHNTDPITNVMLPNLVLTPVFPMRSRAMEFRERSAKACIERAASFAARSPAALVRRACELVSDLRGVKVPGVTPELVAYVQGHTSNAFDALVLRRTAESLRSAGYVDQAANVYYGLLQQHGDDRAAQAELLRLCLACWAPLDGGPGQQPGSQQQAQQAEPDSSSISKLAQFIEMQDSFSAGQILDMLAEARISTPFLLALCRHLLACMSSDANWAKYRDVMVRYVQVSAGFGAEALAALQQQVDRLQARLEPPPQQQQQEGQGQGQGQGHQVGRRHKRRRQQQVGQAGGGPVQQLHQVAQRLLQPQNLERAATGLLLVASLAGGQHLVWRALRTAPLLFLLRKRRGAEGQQ